jgi:hypothetical protein
MFDVGGIKRHVADHRRRPVLMTVRTGHTEERLPV